jgi:DNA-directed RNA polymerase specialized sigma24 family protein
MKLQDPKLLATHRVLERWAVSIGSGLPSDEWDDVPKSRPPPLPDDIATEVDQLVMKSPRRWRRLIRAMYCTPKPTEVIAKEQQCSADTVHRYTHHALEYMRGRFLLRRIVFRLYGSAAVE